MGLLAGKRVRASSYPFTNSNDVIGVEQGARGKCSILAILLPRSSLTFPTFQCLFVVAFPWPSWSPFSYLLDLSPFYFSSLRCYFL